MNKIMIFAMLYPVGGISTFIINLISQLKQSFYFHLVSSGVPFELKKNTVLHDKNITLSTAPIYSIKNLLAIGHIRKIIRDYKPNYIVCMDIFPAVSAVCSRFFSREKIPITIIKVCTPFGFKKKVEWKNKLIIYFLSLFMCSKKDRIVTVSPAVSDYIRSTPLSHIKVQMIPNGIDPVLNRDFSIQQDPLFKHLVFLGRLEYEKGPDRFLQVAKALSTYPVKFHILSEGSMRSELESQVRKYQLENTVIFHGWVDNITPFLLGMDAMLITSRTEGLPYSVLEAFRCRIPIISLNVGGLPYLLQGGKNGYLCKDLQEMINIVKRGFLLDELNFEDKINHATILLKKEFSLLKMGDRYRRLFNNNGNRSSHMNREEIKTVTS